MKGILAYIFLLFSALNLCGQDVIELNDGVVIYGQIVKVSRFTISIIDELNKSAGVQSFSREHVVYVEDNIDEKAMLEEYYKLERTKNIKTSLSAFSVGSVSVAYQRMINRNSSIEIQPTIHGVISNPIFTDDTKISRDISGLGIDLSYRVNLLSLFYPAYKPYHFLSGSYLEIVLGGASVNEYYVTRDTPNVLTPTLRKVNINRNYLHFGPNLGYQQLISNFFTLEAAVGIHFLELTGKKTDVRGDGTIETDKPQNLNPGELRGDENTAVLFYLKCGIAF